MNIFEKYAKKVWEYRKVILAISFVLFLILIPFAAKVTPDNSLEAISVTGDSNIQLVKRVEQLFGSEEYITVGFEAGDIFSSHSLQVVDELTRFLQSQPDIARVVSLTTIWKLKNENNAMGESINVLPFIDSAWMQTGVPLDEKKSLLESPLYKTLIYNDSGTATAVLAQLVPLGGQEEKRSVIIKKVREYVAELSKKEGIKFEIFGWPVMNRAIYETVEKEQNTLTPLMILAITLLVIFLYKNFYVTCITLLQFVMTLGIVMGVLGIFGVHLNWLTAFAPAVMMIMSICDAVYVINEFQKADYALPAWERLKIVYKNIAAPCLFTSIINGLGFLSLVTSSVMPLKAYGFYISIAVVVEYIISFTVFPLLLNTPRSRRKTEVSDNPLLKNLINRAYHLVLDHPKMITIVCVLIIIFSIVGMTQLEANQSSLDLFKTDKYHLKEANDFINKGVGGGIETHVLIDTDNAGELLDPKVLRQIDEVEKQAILQVPSIKKGISIADYTKYFNQVWHNNDPAFYRIPDTREEVAQLFLLMEMEKDKLNLNQFMTDDYSKGVARIFTQVNPTLKDSLDNFEKARLCIRKIFGDDKHGQGTSRSLVASIVIKHLPETVIVSLLVSLLFIGLAMLGLLRSFYVAILSLIPSILPIMMIMGIMGYLHIWINIATAMTFSVSLGIAMDDTINIMWRMKRNVVDRNMSYEAALRQVYDEIGVPLISSSLLLAGGYSMLAFSQLWPTTTMGLFVALCCLFALVGDLLLTPLLLIQLKPFKKSNF